MLNWIMPLVLTLGVATSQTGFGKLDNSTDDLEVRVAVLEAEVENIEDDINDLELDIFENGDDIDDVRDDVGDLEDTVAALLSRIAALEDANNLLQEQVGTLQITVATHEETIATLEDAVENAEWKVNDVSFLATFDSQHPHNRNPLEWNYAVLNSGGHYDTTTGVYTVPLDGTYEFNVQLRGYEDTSTGAWLVVDDVKVSYSTNYDPDDDSQTASMNVLLPLVAGQQVWVQHYEVSDLFGASPSEGMFSWFSGHLVHVP